MTASATSLHPIEILRQRYAGKIDRLIEIFSDPAFVKLAALKGEERPQVEIANFFDEIDTVLLNADLGKYERAFLHRISSLTCFKIRVYDKNRPQRLWNPLDEDFRAFASRVGRLACEGSQLPYPPSETIISWLGFL